LLLLVLSLGAATKIFLILYCRYAVEFQGENFPRQAFSCFIFSGAPTLCRGVLGQMGLTHGSML
jgi:hypothetical protein